ncbi:MAG: hypothetical protein WC845_00990 [Candidatus Staskawiczbacteria bacterium]|jgi:hypothetical protein
MNRKTRLTLFITLVVLYIVISPMLIFYSLGYRFDFDKKRLVSTGGLYVKTWPSNVEVILDKKYIKKTTFLSSEVFYQGLFPKKHNIVVKKDGYFTWEKNLETPEKEVTKLLNVTLIKEKIIFEKWSQAADNMYFSPDNRSILITTSNGDVTNFKILDAETKQNLNIFELSVLPPNFDVIWSQDSNKILIKDINSKYPYRYYLFDRSTGQEPVAEKLTEITKPITNISFNPTDSGEIFFLQNNILYSKKSKTLPVIKDVLNYRVADNKITYLSKTGYVYTTDFSGKNANALNEKPFPTKDESSYEILIFSASIFLKEDQTLLTWNDRSKEFEALHSPVNNIRISPDNSKIIYSNDHEILFSELSNPSEKNFLIRFSEKINDCFWLNNYYLFFNVAGNIKISEIDTRDKVNIAELSQEIYLTDNSTLELKNPEIILGPDNKRIYILQDGSLFSSDPIIDKNDK